MLAAGKLLANGIAGLLDVEIGAAEEAVGFAEGADFLRGETAALEADLIDAANLGGVAIGDHEGRDVLHDLGAAAEDGVFADAAELVDTAEAADDGVILDDHVAGEGAVV